MSTVWKIKLNLLSCDFLVIHLTVERFLLPPILPQNYSVYPVSVRNFAGSANHVKQAAVSWAYIHIDDRYDN